MKSKWFWRYINIFCVRVHSVHCSWSKQGERALQGCCVEWRPTSQVSLGFHSAPLASERFIFIHVLIIRLPGRVPVQGTAWLAWFLMEFSVRTCATNAIDTLFVFVLRCSDLVNKVSYLNNVHVGRGSRVGEGGDPIYGRGSWGENFDRSQSGTGSDQQYSSPEQVMFPAIPCSLSTPNAPAFILDAAGLICRGALYWLRSVACSFRFRPVWKTLTLFTLCLFG